MVLGKVARADQMVQLLCLWGVVVVCEKEGEAAGGWKGMVQAVHAAQAWQQAGWRLH
eukprot:CAMPEP_0202417078 /NCGR_PEP_ID=MMETSP1128-20130828/41850_1 /ASSEMBLY_ACC=CAM_ASM_000463 /TAXON_ID=3047 /ORGANISM="Dunaliella tertiolecta, Strain CCMP1320" /LENGTH=56 /DNA_ID=CAMNT_0049024267 /DNA_START=75 /DNA_END=242 /DNA_ORIENTATION=+